MPEPRGPPLGSGAFCGIRSPSPACFRRVTVSPVSSCKKSTSAPVWRTRATTASTSARPHSRLTVSTRSTGPLAAGCVRRAARGRITTASAAVASAAVAAGPLRLARPSVSVAAGAAAAASGVNDSNGATGPSMRRTRSAAVTLAAAHAASPPATAQEIPVAILDPMSGTVTPYGLPAAETARQRPARPSRDYCSRPPPRRIRSAIQICGRDSRHASSFEALPDSCVTGQRRTSSPPPC